MANSNEYDAIVVGSGISGGWAAKELTEKGLKVLMLERGRDVKHITDYPTTVGKFPRIHVGGRIVRYVLHVTSAFEHQDL